MAMGGEFKLLRESRFGQASLTSFIKFAWSVLFRTYDQLAGPCGN